MLSLGVLFVLVSINLSNSHKRDCVRSPADLSAITHDESMGSRSGNLLTAYLCLYLKYPKGK